MIGHGFPPGIDTRFFFSRPATMRSMAAVKSCNSTADALRRVAASAASLTRFASLPESPWSGSHLFEIDILSQRHLL